jgi:hypothetical protein
MATHPDLLTETGGARYFPESECSRSDDTVDFRICTVAKLLRIKFSTVP